MLSLLPLPADLVPPQSWVFPGMPYIIFTTPLGTHTLYPSAPQCNWQQHRLWCEYKDHHPVGVSLREGIPSSCCIWTPANSGIGSCHLLPLCTMSPIPLSLSFPLHFPLPAFILSGSLESHIYILHIWEVFSVKMKNPKCVP